ncbi:MAG: M48 family metallopeptidase [Terriglobia bacterium]
MVVTRHASLTTSSHPSPFLKLPLVLLVSLLFASRSFAAPSLPSGNLHVRSKATSASSAPGPYAHAPQLRNKAIHYAQTQYALYFGGVTLSLGIFGFLWLAGLGPWLRKLAEKISDRLFIQCLVFIPIFWLIVSAFNFPLDFYGGFTIERRFGLSTENLRSWLGDWGKTFGLTLVVMIFVVWLFYRIVRRAPKRWWLLFWLALIPPALFVMFIEPYVVEPLYFKYTPLDRTHPALSARIEMMLRHAGVSIPESRIYEMNASAKTRALNAYVSGIGKSAHVVIWDTTLQSLTPDETLSVLAHETGHYVLHHVLKEFAWDELIALGWFFIGAIVLAAIVKRKGRATGIDRLGDLASLPLVMLALTGIMFLASPMICAISRHYEAQADQYGLELTYGIVPDPNASMVSSFQILGADDLSDPDPSGFIEFWLFTHPPLDKRIRFAERYRPWAEGKPMKFVRAANSE